MDSVSALKAALAIAQADRQVSPEEIEVLARLSELEALDGWDAIGLREHAAKRVDLAGALAKIQDDPERRYALALCFVMAIAGGVTPPESTMLGQVARQWGFTPEVVAECRREGEILYARLNG